VTFVAQGIDILSETGLRMHQHILEIRISVFKPFKGNSSREQENDNLQVSYKQYITS
jgi:hypothetical protein